MTRPPTAPDVPGHIVIGLLIAGVLAQISYPLLSGAPLRVVTVLSVLLLTSAGVLHAALRWSPRHAAVLFAVAGGIGLAAETIGVHTGYPFGEYVYTGRLGLKVAGVPVLVPIAWTMIAYPALLLGRRLATGIGGTRSRARTALLGGFALAAWDLYLDPQMTAQDAWRFADPHPALPGVPGIPLTNYAGWLLVALIIVAALDRVLPDRPDRRRGWEWPAASVLAWTWLGSAVANLFFFGRPWVGVYGGLVMGLTVLPYLHRLIAVAGAEPDGEPGSGSDAGRGGQPEAGLGQGLGQSLGNRPDHEPDQEQRPDRVTHRDQTRTREQIPVPAGRPGQRARTGQEAGSGSTGPGTRPSSAGRPGSSDRPGSGHRAGSGSRPDPGNRAGSGGRPDQDDDSRDTTARIGER
ncbi:hypothetical protein GCM10022223_49450 [Kineosporia mesophila]|uniref:Carotenoid biosynthesis protein n=1 Tax=Kineosporia mesophila TaxID=566012 RepID=A0ABP7A732_9ACTN|nr:carotenoid biosynthesis protein [Kineosporia mesophila]MCD5351633.1 carotenoid biosynthesis protein [Kineosporia mesophila]